MYTKEIVDVEGSPMECLVFTPEASGPAAGGPQAGGPQADRPQADRPFPGVVVAQHLPVAHMGLEKDPFTVDIGERFAAAGYGCVIPFIFHWWPKDLDMAVKRDEFRDDRAIADLDAAYGLLSALDRVDGDRIGVIGHCWGGRIAWLGACHNPAYKAAAVLYGGRIKVAMGPTDAATATAPIELAGQIKAAMIGVFGNDDENPSPEDVDDMDAALTAAGVEHEFHRYDGAGHGFQDFENAQRYRKVASDDAWEKVMAHFARTLG